MTRKRLSDSELKQFLGTAQNMNRDFFLEISFVLASGWTVRRVCDLTWAEVRSREWPAELVEILQQCSTEFEPFVFKYRSAGSISGMLSQVSGISGTPTDIVRLRAK